VSTFMRWWLIFWVEFALLLGVLLIVGTP